MSTAPISLSAPQPEIGAVFYNGSWPFVRAKTGRRHQSCRLLQPGHAATIRGQEIPLRGWREYLVAATQAIRSILGAAWQVDGPAVEPLQ